MKKMLLSIIGFLFLTGNSFSQTGGHIMNAAELVIAIQAANSNSTYSSYRSTLERQGYFYHPVNAFGVKKDGGAYIIAVGMSKARTDDPTDPEFTPIKTAQMSFLLRDDGTTEIEFFEGNINSDGTLTVTHEVGVASGGGTYVTMTWESWGKCAGAWCGGCLIGCIGSNCGYLGCLATCCGGVALACALTGLFGG